MADTDPVIVQARRTPQGKAGGAFSDVRSEELAVPLVNAVLEETGLTSDDVDDTVWGCARQVKEQGNNFARVVALLSDLGETVPGTTIDRLCASSAQAVMTASDSIRTGMRECIVVGGVESMSRVDRDYGIDSYPGIAERYDVERLQMGMTAETVAERYDVSREAQDEYGARSQQRAVEATESGRFDEEILPIETDEGVVDRDEGLRPGTEVDVLAGLPPVFVEGGTVTAGNASQRSDGAAVLVITSRAFAADHGLEVLAEVGAHSVAGVDPEVMGIGPVPAVRQLHELAGTTIDDYDLVELNEAFASQTLYCQRELDVPDDRLNVNGGAIAIGHPLGASGARLPVTLVHELARRGGGRGCSTMCVGYGQGAAIEFVVP